MLPLVDSLASTNVESDESDESKAIDPFVAMKIHALRLSPESITSP